MPDVLVANENEYVEPPPYTWKRSLQEIVENYTPETLRDEAEYVTFKLDGYELSELHLDIYVRQPHPDVTSPLNFPLINISLVGDAIEDEWLKRLRINSRLPKSARPKGFLYNKGAFRSLIAYLDRELPARGYKGIFLEYVENTQLAAVAERYGFVPVGDPKSLSFVRPLPA